MPGKVSSGAVVRKYEIVRIPSALFLLFAALPLYAAGPEDFAGDEFQVNTWFTNDQRVPALVAHADGNMVAVWQSINQAGPGLSVFGQRLDKAGDFVGGEFRVNDQVQGRQDAAHAAFTRDGGLAVIFTGPVSENAAVGVWIRLFDPDGQPVGSDKLVYFDPDSTQRLPRLASAGKQHMLAVWESQDIASGSEISVLARWLDLEGESLGDAFRLNQPAAGAGRWPDVGLAPGGQAVIAWAASGQDGDSWGVFARCLSGPGETAGKEFQVNQSTTGAQNQPRVAMRDDGRFAVTWWDDIGLSLTQDFYRRVGTRPYGTDCEPLVGEIQVNQFDDGVQDVPAITAASGGYILAWQSYPDVGFARQGIYARRMDASGEFIGDQFRLSQETEAYQDHPTLAATPDGGLLGAWETLGQDESGYGIYARLFLGPRVATILPVSGDGQSTMPGEAFDEPLTVRASDQWGTPLTETELRFSAPLNGPAADFPNGLTEYVVTTDEEGFASTPLVAGSEPGNLEILVSADEGGDGAVFRLTIQGTALSPPIPVPLFGPTGPWLLIVLILGLAAWTGRRQ